MGVGTTKVPAHRTMRYAIKRRTPTNSSDLLGLADKYIDAVKILNDLSQYYMDLGIYDYVEGRFIDP